MARDAHLCGLVCDLTQIDIAGTGDADVGVGDLAFALDGALAGDAHMYALLIELAQVDIAGAGDGESLEFPARQGDLQMAGVEMPAGAIQPDFPVIHLQMGQKLRVAAGMDLVIAAAGIGSLAAYGEIDPIA